MLHSAFASNLLLFACSRVPGKTRQKMDRRTETIQTAHAWLTVAPVCKRCGAIFYTKPHQHFSVTNIRRQNSWQNIQTFIKTFQSDSCIIRSQHPSAAHSSGHSFTIRVKTCLLSLTFYADDALLFFCVRLKAARTRSRALCYPCNEFIAFE